MKYDSYGIPKHKLDDFRSAVHHVLIGKDQEEDSLIFSKVLDHTIKDFSSKYSCKNKEHTVPWINSDILKLMKEQDLALKNNKSKLSHDSQHFMSRNKVLKTLKKAKA